MSIGGHTAVGDVATARKLFGNRDSWSPQSSGWKYWSSDPAGNFQGFQLVNGAVSVVAVEIVEDVDVITNINYEVYTAGSGGTSGQCLIGLFQNGVQLGVTATQHTAFASTGEKVAALTAPATVAKGFVVVGFLPNGGTAPALTCCIGCAASNCKAAYHTNNGLARGGFKTTGSQTSMPSPLGPVTAGGYPWAALS